MNVPTFLKVQTGYRNPDVHRDRHSSGSRKGRYAFTLVELLVVVAVIVLLISILLPTLNKAKDQAKAAVCSTRLKAIMVATTIYTQDYNGWVHAAFGGYEKDHNLGGPNAAGDGKSWFGVMIDEELLPEPWDGDITHCPLTNVASFPYPSFYGYGMRATYPPGTAGNYEADGWYGADGLYGTGYFQMQSPLVQRRAGLESNPVFTYDYRPWDFVLYMDSRRSAFLYRGMYPQPAMQWYLVFDVPCCPDDEDCRVHIRHNNRANCAFADGHVEPVGRNRLNDLGFKDGCIWPEP